MIQTEELSLAIKQICEEKGIPYESVIQTIESALAVAYRKEFGKKGQDIRVEFNPIDGSYRIFDVKTVVEDELVKEWEEMEQKREAGEEIPKPEKTEEGEEEKKYYNPRTDLSLTEAKKIKPEAQVGDELKTELTPPPGYGRMAAQTAKQVIIQKLREAERETVFTAYKDRVNQIVPATVQRVEGRLVFVDLGQAVALLPPPEQSYGEVYRSGQRLKVYLVSIAKGTRGPEILASRAHPGLVTELFKEEVPEIANGTIEIKGVVREAGWRSKIAVSSQDKNIDPIGSCVGQRGTRVQTVIAELGGEKIDIIEYADKSAKYISNALSPAKVLNVKLDEENKRAVVEVKDDQFSLAIGKNGQNVRLASKLTGWEIDVVKEEGENTEANDKKNDDT